jgi:hypothetical protein
MSTTAGAIPGVVRIRTAIAAGWVRIAPGLVGLVVVFHKYRIHADGPVWVTGG